MDNKRGKPMTVVSKTISTENDMLLDLQHPGYRNTVVYVSKDHKYLISATRKAGNKKSSWVKLNGQPVRSTQLGKIVRSIEWA